MTIQHGVDMIVVEWRDALHDSGFWDLDSPRPNIIFTIKTTGYLVDEDESAIVIATDWEPKLNRFRHWSVILKVNIIQQKRWKIKMPAPQPGLVDAQGLNPDLRASTAGVT